MRRDDKSCWSSQGLETCPETDLDFVPDYFHCLVLLRMKMKLWMIKILFRVVQANLKQQFSKQFINID